MKKKVTQQTMKITIHGFLKNKGLYAKPLVIGGFNLK